MPALTRETACHLLILPVTVQPQDKAKPTKIAQIQNTLLCLGEHCNFRLEETSVMYSAEWVLLYSSCSSTCYLTQVHIWVTAGDKTFTGVIARLPGAPPPFRK